MLEGSAARPGTLLRKLGGLTVACALAATASAQKALPQPEPGPKAIGTSYPIRIVPDLQQSFRNNGTLLWADMIAVHGASFVKAHLVDVNLRAGDVLVLKSSSGHVIEEIRGRGPKGMGSFWALSAFGEELVLEFRFSTVYEKAPFRIDQVILGDPSMFEPALSPESVCFPENFDDVFCYQGDAGKWSNVMASVGVMTVGGNPVSALWCSGSNISPSNYLLTNQHCITSQAECDTTEFVFKFYRQGCNNGAPVTTDWEGFRCDDVVATSPFVSCDQGLGDLDYSLCSVLGDPAATYGFATPDSTPITDGEAIYMIQHPAGRPHEITHGSGADVDASGTVLRYYNTLDSEGGSSGSPIYREADDKLIGLHHCGGCESAGVGNRGMLMSDIYPEIQTFLCTATVDLAAGASSGFVQESGDGDTVLEPGETWRFTPSVRNLACSQTALGVTGQASVNAASAGIVTLLQSGVSFGDIAGGASANAAAPVRFRVLQNAPCGSVVSFDLTNLQASNGGPFSDALEIVTGALGEEPLTTLFFDDFSAAPGGWTTVNGGTGAGPASTWTAANPGLRSLLTAPFYICDSDELGTGFNMNEELISPVDDCTGFISVQLQFAHDFNWYSGGLDEQCDVDVRSSATGGAWVNVVKFQDADASGTVSVDISAQAAGQADVQLRFHYYNAQFEWWWAVDDVFLLGSNGFDCDVYRTVTFSNPTPTGPGRPKRP